MALILSRRPGESLTMTARGPDGRSLVIEVTVTNLTHGQVRLAIDAPREVTILRTELLNPPGEEFGDGID